MFCMHIIYIHAWKYDSTHHDLWNMCMDNVGFLINQFNDLNVTFCMGIDGNAMKNIVGADLTRTMISEMCTLDLRKTIDHRKMMVFHGIVYGIIYG